MNNFEMAKKNYERGLWTKEMLGRLVEKGRLNTEEYKTITRDEYSSAK